MERQRHMLARAMVCPWCLEPNNAVFPTTPEVRPRPGDASLCGHCGCWAIFEADHMRKPTVAEQVELAEDEHCQAMLADFIRLGPMPRPHPRRLS